WDVRYTTEGKEFPRWELGGWSQRQALISVSEDVVRPTFGKDFWGKREARKLEERLGTEGVLAVSEDSGFVEELIPLQKTFGETNVHLVRIHSEGCSFEGDSRDYLPDSVIKGEVFDILN